jgi:hypothetical protein
MEEGVIMVKQEKKKPLPPTLTRTSKLKPGQAGLSGAFSDPNFVSTEEPAGLINPAGNIQNKIERYLQGSLFSTVDMKNLMGAFNRFVESGNDKELDTLYTAYEKKYGRFTREDFQEIISQYSDATGDFFGSYLTWLRNFTVPKSRDRLIHPPTGASIVLGDETSAATKRMTIDRKLISGRAGLKDVYEGAFLAIRSWSRKNVKKGIPMNRRATKKQYMDFFSQLGKYLGKDTSVTATSLEESANRVVNNISNIKTIIKRYVPAQGDINLDFAASSIYSALPKVGAKRPKAYNLNDIKVILTPEYYEKVNPLTIQRIERELDKEVHKGGGEEGSYMFYLSYAIQEAEGLSFFDVKEVITQMGEVNLPFDVRPPEAARVEDSIRRNVSSYTGIDGKKAPQRARFEKLIDGVFNVRKQKGLYVRAVAVMNRGLKRLTRDRDIISALEDLDEDMKKRILPLSNADLDNEGMANFNIVVRPSKSPERKGKGPTAWVRRSAEELDLEEDEIIEQESAYSDETQTMSAVDVSNIIPPTTSSEERTVEQFIQQLKDRLVNLKATTDTKLSVKNVQDAYKDYLKAYQALEKMVGDFNAESGRQDRSVNRKGKKVTIKGDGLEATLGKDEQGSSIVKIEGKLTDYEKGKLDELEMGPFITGFAPSDLLEDFFETMPELRKMDVASLDEEERREVKTYLQDADPTSYFGEEYLKLGNLIEILEGVQEEGDEEMLEGMKEENLKVVKLAARLRKLYENLYEEIRETVYPEGDEEE